MRTGVRPLPARQSSMSFARSSRLSATSTTPSGGRTAGSLAEGGRGIETVNRLPWPSRLSTWMVPYMLSTRFLTMAIPRPVPSILLTALLWTRSKGTKIRSRNSSLMPMPLSSQAKSNQMRPLPPGRWEKRTRMLPPSWVYLTALPVMFTRICRRRRGSPTRHSSRMSPISKRKDCFFCTAWGRTMTARSWTMSAREKRSSLMIIRPLSIRDMSSTSLTKLIRWTEAVRIFSRQSFTRAFSSMWLWAMEVIPMMAFIGVRISWDILERKRLLA